MPTAREWPGTERRPLRSFQIMERGTGRATYSLGNVDFAVGCIRRESMRPKDRPISDATCAGHPNPCLHVAVGETEERWRRPRISRCHGGHDTRCVGERAIGVSVLFRNGGQVERPSKHSYLCR